MMAYANGDIREFAPAHFRSLLRDELRYAATALTTGSENTIMGQFRGSMMSLMTS